jgi:hypothetical protein
MKKALLTGCCLLLASMAFAGASRSNPDMDTPTILNPHGGGGTFLGKADVLYVNDTSGTFDGSYNGCYGNAVTACGLSYDTITTAYYGDGPNAATMAGYQLVIWDTYDDWWSGSALTANDVSNLTTFVSGGGKLWLIGQDINYSVPTGWTTFRNTYLGVSSVTDDVVSGDYTETAAGISGTFTEGHTSVSLSATQCFTANGFYTDSITPGAAFGTYTVNGSYTSSVCYNSGSYKTAYYTLHLECYTQGTVPLQDMIINHLSWFGLNTAVQPKSLGDIKAMFN